MRLTQVLIAIGISTASLANAQQGATSAKNVVPKENWSRQMAATVMSWWNDSAAGKPAKWSYDMGVVLKGMQALWYATGDGDYFRYIQKSMDAWVQDDGTIKGYNPDEFNIDNINDGKLLLTLFRLTEKPK